MKRCIICGARKRLEDFPKVSKTNFRTECRECYNHLQRIKMRYRNAQKKRTLSAQRKNATDNQTFN